MQNKDRWVSRGAETSMFFKKHRWWWFHNCNIKYNLKNIVGICIKTKLKKKTKTKVQSIEIILVSKGISLESYDNSC